MKIKRQYILYDGSIYEDNFYDSDYVLCMTNIRGNKVKNPTKLPFSFYYSSKIVGNGSAEVSHSIRIKVHSNPNKIIAEDMSDLIISGGIDNWELKKNKNDKNIGRMETKIKRFFRLYLVFFSLVWDRHLGEDELEDYFEGDIDLQELISCIDFYEKYEEDLSQIFMIDELEEYLVENNLVNMYGN